mgnify:CR=1 FL=1
MLQRHYQFSLAILYIYMLVEKDIPHQQVQVLTRPILAVGMAVVHQEDQLDQAEALQI